MYRIEIELEVSDDLVDFTQKFCRRNKLDFRLAMLTFARNQILYGKILRKEKICDDDRTMDTDW